jgi:protein-tyrosine phosphatase
MRILSPRLIAVVLLTGLVIAQGQDKVRHLPLSGAPNFRDLGGYATTDGHHTRWGLVYRSGELSQLTAKDYEFVARLGITAVCDLRREDERTAAPTHWPGSNAPAILTMPTPARFGPTTRELLLKGMNETDMKARMRSVYEQMVVGYAPAFRDTLHRILDTAGPTLYHCSAGKDRTGVLSALLLSFLGVPRETVFQDYLLSDVYFDTAPRVDAMARELHASRAAVRAALTADRTYLEAAFMAIDRNYQSLDNYRRAELRLSDQDLLRLKARLLEP